jgi:hypothetical protein
METRPMRILVCGGREWSNYTMTSGVLDGFRQQYHEKGQPIVIVQGGAIGADFLGKRYAEQYNIPCEEFKAEWKKYGRAAGPIRNSAMLETLVPGADVVVAFPGGRGTNDTVTKALKLGIRVWKPAKAELYDLATD